MNSDHLLTDKDIEDIVLNLDPSFYYRDKGMGMNEIQQVVRACLLKCNQVGQQPVAWSAVHRAVRSKNILTWSRPSSNKHDAESCFKQWNRGWLGSETEFAVVGIYTKDVIDSIHAHDSKTHHETPLINNGASNSVFEALRLAIVAGTPTLSRGPG
jgi:hypothetical protein